MIEIILLLSSNEYSNINELPSEIQLLEKHNRIKLIFVNESLTYQSRTLITMKSYKNNAIIIINNECKLPDGWLEMFINDHLKYPNDAIAASIQYFFGKNGKIKELSEGFKGKKYGTFNHVTEMIFNFALFNIDLGGILFPKNFFKNSYFYKKECFEKINSEEFWESAFIMIEDKILRQSSKIFDYTKYLINKINFEELHQNKIKLLEKSKIYFMKEYPNFKETIKKRQNKIIVSITSYPKRFVYLPDLMIFIRNQTLHINETIFFLYKDDMKFFNLNISDVKIIVTEQNLKPHLKYFYAMKLYKDYAIITLDDDIGYANDTFESLFNAYIENPNVINGRRTHLMTYNDNGELRGYLKWVFEQKLIKEPNFNLTLTNVGGTIFPPDILNINDDILPIINETLTCDDLTLKYLANIKGIPPKWVINQNIMGIERNLPQNNGSCLFEINKINNDICISKLNMMINKTLLKNLCVPYKNFPTGNSIYLFDIHNNNLLNNNILTFDINAYSYCPIDKQIKFNIYFDSHISNCSFNESKNLNYNKSINNNKNSLTASCYMYYSEDYINYNFPYAKSEDNININIFNYRKSLTHIFKKFFCIKHNNCILKLIILEKKFYKYFSVTINEKQYSCQINNGDDYPSNILPYIKTFKCNLSNFIQYKNEIIGGIPININIRNKAQDKNIIPKIFIISRIVTKTETPKKGIIIIGKFYDNREPRLYKFSINLLYPKTTLQCNLKPFSKYVQSLIYCNNELEKLSQILVENQITNSPNEQDKILLINEETLIKIYFIKDNQMSITKYQFLKPIKRMKVQNFFTFIYIILILLTMKFYKMKLFID